MFKGYQNFDYGQIHYLTAGDTGPSIVLLHESPLSNRVFEKCIPALSEWAQVFAPDTPGYGNSDALAKSSTLADYAKVIGESIKLWAGDRQVLICGTHTGASLAIELVNQFPNIASGLFLIGVPFYTEAESSDRIANWCPDIEITEEGEHLNWAWRRYQKIWPTAPLLDRNMAVLDMLSVSDKYNWGYLQAFNYAVGDRIKNVNCALRISAAENEFLFAGSKRLAEQINADFTVFAGLDGQVPLRAPDLFSEELKKFHESLTGIAK
jgi:pimeloyl-ACP methyl ester carboxylesterase